MLLIRMPAREYSTVEEKILSAGIYVGFNGSGMLSIKSFNCFNKFPASLLDFKEFAYF